MFGNYIQKWEFKERAFKVDGKVLLCTHYSIA